MPVLARYRPAVFLLAATLPAASAAPPGGLELTVMPLRAEYGQGQAVTLQLRVRNAGPGKLELFRPRAGNLTRHGGDGYWTVSVQGPGGAYRAFVFPGPAPVVTLRDLTVLPPGGSLTVSFELGAWGRWNAAPRFEDAPTVSSTPGLYRVRVGYRSKNAALYGDAGEWNTFRRAEGRLPREYRLGHDEQRRRSSGVLRVQDVAETTAEASFRVR